MTTTSAIPAAEAAPHMADPPDTEAQAPPQPMPAARAKASTGRPRLRDQAAENPLLTLFGTIIIALLVFTLGTTNLRISDTNDRIDRLEDRFDRLENRVIEMDRNLTAQIVELDRKLTALIAHLNATAAVDAALEGRLLPSDVGDRDSQPDREPPDG